MKVYLLQKEELIVTELPSKISGSYWIKDNSDNNIVNIESDNLQWKVSSNEDVTLMSQEVEVPASYLKIHQVYLLKVQKTGEILLLYIAPIYDETFQKFKVMMQESIIIGKNALCQIQYNHPLIQDQEVKLVWSNGSFVLQNLKKQFGAYVNHKLVSNAVIKNGDIIFIMGLQIVVLGQNLMINNPSGLMTLNSNLFHIVEKLKFQLKPEDLEETETTTKEEIEFFYRSPKFRTALETLEMNIDAPPTKQESENVPILYVIGPMLTMGMTSLVMGLVAINNVLNNGRDWSSAIPSLAISGAMLMSTILWPLLSKRYQKKKEKQKELLRQNKYSVYIEEKRLEIIKGIKSQTQVLIDNHYTEEQCEAIILNRKRNIWEKKFEEEEFLTVNVGNGNLPMKINIQYPTEHFSLEDDNLRDMLSKLADEPKKLYNVPVTTSLKENKVTAIIGQKNLLNKFLDNILLQIMTVHSYEDLKIAVLTNSNHQEKYEYLKCLPHCWSNDKSVRFFATTSEEKKKYPII